MEIPFIWSEPPISSKPKPASPISSALAPQTSPLCSKKPILSHRSNKPNPPPYSTMISSTPTNLPKPKLKCSTLNSPTKPEEMPGKVSAPQALSTPKIIKRRKDTVGSISILPEHNCKKNSLISISVLSCSSPPKCLNLTPSDKKYSEASIAPPNKLPNKSPKPALPQKLLLAKSKICSAKKRKLGKFYRIQSNRQTLHNFASTSGTKTINWTTKL